MGYAISVGVEQRDMPHKFHSRKLDFAEMEEEVDEAKGRKKELRQSGSEEEAKKAAVVEEEFVDYTTATNDTRIVGDSVAVVFSNDTLQSTALASAPSLSTLLICLFWLISLVTS